MDNKKKDRNRVDKYKSKYTKKRWGIDGYKPEKVITTTQSESMHMQDGDTRPTLEFCRRNLL